MKLRALLIVSCVCSLFLASDVEAGDRSAPRCGNGVLDRGEQCDPPASLCAAPCKEDCTCDFSNCCQCGDQCAQGFFCPRECAVVQGGSCTASGECALPCVCGTTCTTLAGNVGTCRPPERGSGECFCQARRPLPDDLVALARRLETIPVVDDDEADTTIPPSRGDVDRPSVGLPMALDLSLRLLASASDNSRPSLQIVQDSVRRAWTRYSEGGRDLSYLGRTADAIWEAQGAIGHLLRFRTRPAEL
jgi:hypothetical protein